MSYKDTIKEAKEEGQKESLPATDIESEEIEATKKELRRKTWQFAWQVAKGANSDAIENIYNQNKKAIRKLAYILHDKDKKEDGVPKEPHFHVVLTCNYSVAVSTVANWFSFDNYNMVRVCKGKDSYNDILLYFTHQNYKNNIQKMHYEASLIHQLGEVVDIEEVVNNKLECKSPRKRQRLSQSLKEKLLQGEISYSYIRKNFQDLFVNNIKRFQEINQERIKTLPIPEERINIYITGAGGAGKDFLTDLLAYFLTSKEDFEIDEDSERVYTAGGAKVALQEYNGQELIAFRDYRAGNLLEAFDGRGGVFGAFDTTPRKTAFNIKYGSVTLKNKYSIVNSVQTFEEFSNLLCKLSEDELKNISDQRERQKKRYENKVQTLRRWAFIIHILDDSILIKINNNFLYPNSYHNEYTTYAIDNIKLSNAIELIKQNAITGTQEEIFKLTLKHFPCLVKYIKDAIEVHAFNRQPKQENSALGELASNISIRMYEELATSNFNNIIREDNNNGNEGANTQRKTEESIPIPNEES